MPIAEKTKNEALELMRKGELTMLEIADKLKVSVPSLQNWKRAAGLTKKQAKKALTKLVKIKGKKGKKGKAKATNGAQVVEYAAPPDAYATWMAQGVKYGWFDRLRAELAKI